MADTARSVEELARLPLDELANAYARELRILRRSHEQVVKALEKCRYCGHTRDEHGSGKCGWATCDCGGFDEVG